MDTVVLPPAWCQRLFTLGFGGGMPIGALIASAKVADVFKPGDHASTFWGNPLVTSAAGCFNGID